MNIDLLTEQIGIASEQIREKLINYLIDEFQKSGNINQAIQKIASTNITELILNDFGLGKELNKAIALYPGIVNDIREKVGKVDDIMVKNLALVDRSYLINHVRDVGNNLTRGLIQGVVGDLSIKQLRETLLQNTSRLADYQINALTNTTIRTYSSAVFADSAEKFLPNTVRYRYVGPNDGKTRENCKCFLSWQKPEGMTLAEIRSNPCGIDFVYRGGFNCRHDFELVFSSVENEI